MAQRAFQLHTRSVQLLEELGLRGGTLPREVAEAEAAEREELAAAPPTAAAAPVQGGGAKGEQPPRVGPAEQAGILAGWAAAALACSK